MNENKINMIKAKKGAKHVSEFLSTIPFGILNKKKTGCGATSLMLENKENVIVCCPTKQLIENKVGQYPIEGRCSFVLLGVKEGISAADIKHYIADCEGKQPVKILVTYDSLLKVKNAIGGLDDYHIVVDEYQELLDACVYREDAILSLLKLLKDKPNVTYLSATPIPFRYIPKELSHLEWHEIEWEDNELICPYRIKTKTPFAVVEKMISLHKNGEVLNFEGISPVKEYYFFLNSVRAIQRIIENTGLSNDDVKVICAETATNRKILNDITISRVSDLNKTFTFCTKTAFCGTDFYSESGLIVVVSDGRNSNTRLDVDTDIFQIAGRIRNEENPFKNTILHIYNTGITQSKEKFNNKLNENIKSAEKFIEAHKALNNEEYKEAIRHRLNKNDVDELVMYNEETGEVEINQLKLSYVIYKHEIVDIIYQNGYNIRKAYKKAGYDMSVSQKWVESLGNYAYNIAVRSSFKDLYEEYCREMNQCYFGMSPRAKEIRQQEPLVVKAYFFCKKEELDALQYNKKKIKERIYENLPATQQAVKSLTTEEFSIGEKYSNSVVKKQLQVIYDKLLINKKAVATDLKKYIKVKEGIKISEEGGKRKDGIQIGIALTMFSIFSKKIKTKKIRLCKV